MDELLQMSDEGLIQTIQTAQSILSQRAEQRKEQAKRERELLQIGEHLDTEAYINCGNCPKCGYGEDRDSTIRPHGPYAYLYKRSKRSKSGYSCTYVPKARIPEERERIQRKREQAEREAYGEHALSKRAFDAAGHGR